MARPSIPKDFWSSKNLLQKVLGVPLVLPVLPVSQTKTPALAGGGKAYFF